MYKFENPLFLCLKEAQRKKLRLRFAPPQIADASLRKEETNRFASSPPGKKVSPSAGGRNHK